MRVLAPLLVMAFAAVLVWRWYDAPRLSIGRERLEAAWDTATFRPEERPAFVAAIDRYLAEFGSTSEARWDAARAYLKAGEVKRAVEAVREETATDEGARRFGELVLRVVGFEDDRRLLRPTAAAPAAVLALADGGVEAALEVLAREASRHDNQAILTLFEGVFTFASGATADRVVRGLRQSEMKEAAVVAALISLGPEPYAERDADIERLVTVLDSEMRVRVPLVWELATAALGRSEDERAVAALEATREKLQKLPAREARRPAAVAAAGLVASGRWDATDALQPFLGRQGAGSPVRLWYAEAILQRLSRGDSQAPAHLADLRTSLRVHPDPILLSRLGHRLLLADAPRVEDVEVDLLLKELTGRAADAAGPVIADAHRYRQGEASARGALLAHLVRLADEGWVTRHPVGAVPMATNPILTAARALLLY